MLVAHHFLLLFKVGNCLCQTLLKDLNLVLASFNFVGLHGGSLGVLLLSALVDRNVSHNLFIRFLLLLDLPLLLFKFVSLRNRLQGQLLVFIVDLSLDRLNGYAVKPWLNRLSQDEEVKSNLLF